VLGRRLRPAVRRRFHGHPLIEREQTAEHVKLDILNAQIRLFSYSVRRPLRKFHQTKACNGLYNAIFMSVITGVSLKGRPTLFIHRSPSRASGDSDQNVPQVRFVNRSGRSSQRAAYTMRLMTKVLRALTWAR
jgi:hypothetical protein